MLVLVRALKNLRQLENFHPPAGARRVHFAKSRGDEFPAELLKPDHAHTLTADRHYLVFVGEFCSLCHQVMPSLLVLGKSKTLISAASWDENPPNDLLVAPEVFNNLKIRALPFVLRLEKGRVADYGVINTPDNLESLL